MGKGTFLGWCTLLGVVLVFAVYQVPQPWRGVLVAWFLFLATAGVFALRVLKHYVDYRAQHLSLRATKRVTPPRRSLHGSSAKSARLRVVTSASGGNGRHVLN